LDIEPENAKSWELLGIACEALNEFKKAIKYYGKALELDPELVLAKRNLEILESIQ